MSEYGQYINFHTGIEKKQLDQGILLQSLGHVRHLNVVHWNLPDGADVPRHEHPQEQFGYVIEGGFEMEIGDERYTLGKGDSYFIPANVSHHFVAIGDTEAIDIFSPIRDVEAHYK